MKYCHFTNIKNLPNILSTHTLKADADAEGVYVCKNRSDLLPFVITYMKVGIKQV